MTPRARKSLKRDLTRLAECGRPVDQRAGVEIGGVFVHRVLHLRVRSAGQRSGEDRPREEGPETSWGNLVTGEEYNA